MSGQCPVCDMQCLWGDLVRFIHSLAYYLGNILYNLIFVHRKRKGVGKRDEEKERKKKTAKRGKKTAKEPLAEIPEEKEEEEEQIDVRLRGGGAFSDDEDLFGALD